MFNTSIDKGGIKNLENLALIFDSAPAKIQKANDLAARNAQQKIEKDLRSRGRPGRFIAVNYKKYGQYGLKFSFEIKPGRGGSRGGSKSRQYSAIWAARVFLWSEMGMTGRRAFVLPLRMKTRTYKGRKRMGDYIETVTKTQSYAGRYVISHSSGRWKKGRSLEGPLKIPQMGPFHFSSMSGKPRKTIKRAATDIISIELNKQYDKVLGKMAGR
jgi:hypothetical protein